MCTCIHVSTHTWIYFPGLPAEGTEEKLQLIAMGAQSPDLAF